MTPQPVSGVPDGSSPSAAYQVIAVLGVFRTRDIAAASAAPDRAFHPMRVMRAILGVT
jgi:hypothetical protein